MMLVKCMALLLVEVQDRRHFRQPLQVPIQKLLVLLPLLMEQALLLLMQLVLIQARLHLQQPPGAPLTPPIIV